MKWMIFVMFSLAVIASKAQPTPVQLRPMQDYFYVGDGQNLKAGTNCFVITSKKGMKKLFGETNRVDTPDFSKEWVIVLVMPKAKWHNKIEIQEISMKAGKFIEVYCKVTESNKRLTYDFNPIKVCAIPIYKGINKINFYNGKHMRPLASVEVD